MREPDAPRGRRFTRSYVAPEKPARLLATWSMITSESTGGSVTGTIGKIAAKPTPERSDG